MTNSADWFCDSFLVLFTLACSLFLFSGNVNGICKRFYDGELPL